MKDTAVAEVDMEEPEKAKARSGEAAGVNKHSHSVQATMEIVLEKVENQSGMANAGTEGSEVGTG